MAGKLISEVSEFCFSAKGDDRGQLIALESNLSIPFDVKRVYYMFNTTKGAERGFHAHIALQQMAICVSGSCVMDVEYQNGRESYILDSPDKGLYMGGLVWREMRNFSPDCVLMVLADALYSEDDYIREYDEFKQRNSALIDLKTKGV